MEKSTRKKVEKIDGLSPKDIENIRKAIRKAWMYSHPRKLAKLRCQDEEGFYHCEQCKKKTPTIAIDHITAVGNIDAGFIERLYCPSKDLMALCKKCHDKKTREERKVNANSKTAHSAA